jgi:hypothetical protein
MPAGCSFICDNSKCEQYKNGLTINSPWPMAKIEIVISNLSKIAMFKTSHKETLDKIIDYKNNGRKFACIIYPNNNNLEKVAYLFQFWSPEAKTIWEYDIETNGKSLEDILKSPELPDKCPKTGCKLLNFNDVIREGINCPHCGEK